MLLDRTGLPSFIRMLEAGSRVCKVGSILSLLLGPTNYQFCPPGVVRIGLVYISVIPNNETRAWNIYYKHAENENDDGNGNTEFKAPAPAPLYQGYQAKLL